MFSIDDSGSLTVLVLGPESAESISELARGSAEKVAGDFVAQYLSGKQAEWKRPAAKVLPFRRRKLDK
jgi:hypothetical protein